MRGIVVLVAFLLAVDVGIVRGGVVRVPEDYPSVLEAVDAVSAGDSVLVGPGTWADSDLRWVTIGGQLLPIESTAFLRPGVTVIGTEGPDGTVLDGALADDTVIHVFPGTLPARLVGLTITGSGNGLTASGSSPLELVNCRVIDNARVGILSGHGQKLVLEDCFFTGNEHTTPLLHGAIDGNDIDLSCTRCVFVENHGAAVHLQHGRTVTIRDCLFADHQVRGVRFSNGVDELLVEGSLFLRNSVSSSAGGGAMVVSGGTGIIRFCTFAYDSSGNGGALAIADSQILIEDNTFYRCHGDPAAGAIALEGSNAEARNNIFAKSTGQRGAVRKTGGPTHPDTDCNLFWDNEGGDYFGDWVPGPNDVNADPQFCDESLEDFTLMGTSPAAATNSPSCGQIGAHSVGCGVVSVNSESWGRIKTQFRGPVTDGGGQ